MTILHARTYIYAYIYICISRERERERERERSMTARVALSPIESVRNWDSFLS